VAIFFPRRFAMRWKAAANSGGGCPEFRRTSVAAP
jgi:hypothetical protein